MLHRVGIGRIWHESNSFFVQKTSLEDFQAYPGGLLVGEALFHQPDHTDEITGMLEVFRPQAGVELVPLLAAGTEPSGPVAQDFVEILGQMLIEQLQLAGQLDATHETPFRVPLPRSGPNLATSPHASQGSD